MAGFPPDLNTVEMKRVSETCSDLDVQPVTLMSALLRTEDQVILFTSLFCIGSVKVLCAIYKYFRIVCDHLYHICFICAKLLISVSPAHQ